MGVRLKQIIEFEGTLHVLESGLRIGAAADNVGPGENDNPILRHPISGLPYVPGSSIKGKIRSLLESKYSSRSQQTGSPCDCGTCIECQLFGCGGTQNMQPPTRLVFRDCQPTNETRRIWDEANVSSEVRTGVRIDRRTGQAAGKALFPIERIPANSAFEFSFAIRHFDGDELKALIERIAEGLELVEKHYLGGCGSRGYGHVAFRTRDGAPMAEHLRQQAKEFARA
jgi:CRISPR-associated protein Csm3